MSDKTLEKLFLFFSGLILLFVVFSWPVSSYFEAKAYKNLTGKEVTTWDAMFLELRVTNE
jgi:hypothetical protein